MHILKLWLGTNSITIEIHRIALAKYFKGKFLPGSVLAVQQAIAKVKVVLAHFQSLT